MPYSTHSSSFGYQKFLVKDKELHNLCLIFMHRERKRDTASGVCIINVVENGFLYSRRKQNLFIKF
jgi:hypothetical protein